MPSPAQWADSPSAASGSKSNPWGLCNSLRFSRWDNHRDEAEALPLLHSTAQAQPVTCWVHPEVTLSSTAGVALPELLRFSLLRGTICQEMGLQHCPTSPQCSPAPPQLQDLISGALHTGSPQHLSPQLTAIQTQLGFFSLSKDE